MTANSPSGPANVYYGGQAVIEGVMIRGPEHMAVAVRHPKGHIVTHSEHLSGLYTGRARRWLFVRGLLVLWETLALGMRALSYASRVALEEEDEEGEPVEFPEKVFWGSMVVALGFVIAIFFAAPVLASNLLHLVDASRLVIVLVEGLVRLALFVGYIWAIGFMPEIRRVYQYHGAEHMTIHAHEHGSPLTPEGVRPYPKEHTRCGTSFLLVVVVVAFFVHAVFDYFVDEGLVIRMLSRLLLIIPIASLSYEVLRIGARWGENGFVKTMFKPNIALQALTTKVPDDSQIEVAIASFQATLRSAGMLDPEAAQAFEDAPPLG